MFYFCLHFLNILFRYKDLVLNFSNKQNIYLNLNGKTFNIEIFLLLNITNSYFAELF